MEWNLKLFYESVEVFRSELNAAKELVSSLANYKGKLGNPESFKEYYQKQIYFQGNYEKLYLYASCYKDMDMRNQEAVSLVQEVMFMFQNYGIATAFENSEIIALGKEYVDSCLNKYPELKELSYGFENLFRQQSHVLSDKEQTILANYGQVADSGYGTYESITSGDEKEYYAKVNGKKVSIKASNWTTYIREAKDNKTRQNILNALYQSYEDYKNTYASIYNSILQADIAQAKSMHFDTALEMHLFRNNIPTSLYLNLIKVAHKLAPSAKRYYKIRKNAMGLKTHHTYDRFLSLAPESDKKYTYEEGKELFFKSIEKFDDEFKEMSHEVLKDGYVDVYPKTGKRGGAYSNSTPNVHPVILLNYNETLNDVFTLAHESGHSTHTLFSEKYQPVSTQNYTIFVAEIASTFNEHNLLDYLLTKGTLTKNEKISLIQNAIDDIMSTFYRQVLFAEYEYIAHTKAENGEPITHETLSNIMVDLYKRYYGIDINKEGAKKYIWAYVHHFFGMPYYVYQYATSFSASLAIYQNVKENGKVAFDQYKELLKSGGSDYPIELVKRAGVDFTTTKPLLKVVERMNDLLDDLEKALNE